MRRQPVPACRTSRPCPLAAWAGVQMNCLVIRNVNHESSRQARTPERSAWTRNPAVSTQAGWSMCSTIVWPGARAARVATTRGRAWSMSLVLVRVPGITASTATPATAARERDAGAQPGGQGRGPAGTASSTRPAR